MTNIKMTATLEPGKCSRSVTIKPSTQRITSTRIPFTVSGKCLIIAAGEGNRLRRRGYIKPLIPVLGIPLIERVIRSAIEAGANDFYVVTGYQSQHVHAFLDRLARRLGFPITTIFNDAWKEENGLSVLKARESLREPFLLLMSDHLFDPSIARTLMGLPLSDGEIILGVDMNKSNPLVDMDDVTRVKTEGKKILHIEKGLANHNGFDTGIFVCTPSFFDALERSAKEFGDTSLSGAVRVLSGDGLARAFDIDNRFWIDVDDPAAFKKAEKALLDNLRDKFNDGPVSRHLNRPISAMFSHRLVKFDITPNQISLISFLCSILAAGLFALGGYLTLLLGGVLAQFASIIDGSDGEVARLKYQSSNYGGWFDAVLDRYADAFLLFGLTWHLLAAEANGWVLFAGFMAIIGSFMLSYTADKYDKLMRERIAAGAGAWVRMGRDVRVFIIFLGAVTNLVLPVLVIIAVVMNFETLRRIIVLATGSFDCTKQKIRLIIAGSRVPEDPRHADNTLLWLLRLNPDADNALQIAALAHDIDRADEDIKIKRMDFNDYDAFKAAHARNGAEILQSILTGCGVQQGIMKEACRLVTCHEVGGDPRSDLLKDADSLSYFDVNLPLYFEREGLQETKRRLLWGYRRLSRRAKETVSQIEFKDEVLTRLVREVMEGGAC